MILHQERGATWSCGSHGRDAGVVMYSGDEVVMRHGGGRDIVDPNIAHGGHVGLDRVEVGSNPGASRRRGASHPSGKSTVGLASGGGRRRRCGGRRS